MFAENDSEMFAALLHNMCRQPCTRAEELLVLIMQAQIYFEGPAGVYANSTFSWKRATTGRKETNHTKLVLRVLLELKL